MKSTKKYQELNAENIQRLLQTKVIGKEIIYLQEIDSTNQYGLKLLKSGIVSNGTLIVANYQTKGRGRHGKKWIAPRGKTLLFSIVLTDLQRFRHLPLLTFAGALGVADGITHLYPEFKPTIRWPNDIMIQGKKIAGVLSETSTRGRKNKIAGAVLGIGINVNQSIKDFPKEIAGNVASLFMFTGRRILRLNVLIAVLQYFEKYYLALEQGQEKRFWSRLRKLSSTLGKGVRIHTSSNKITEGTAVDIDEDGGLLVRLDDGRTVKFCDGEVEEVEWME